MKDDRVPYMMLFCALILVKKRKASLAESVMVVPAAGKAHRLATELVMSQSLAEPGRGC